MVLVLIPLEINESRLILNVSILIQRLGLRPLKFIVDTGSPKTFIGATDSVRLGIDKYVKDSQEKETIVMGKTSMNLKILRNVKIYTKSDENKIRTFDLPRLGVVEELLMADKNRQVVMPNLIGLDFIKENDLSLHYISKENKAYFD